MSDQSKAKRYGASVDSINNRTDGVLFKNASLCDVLFVISLIQILSFDSIVGSLGRILFRVKMHQSCNL